MGTYLPKPAGGSMTEAGRRSRQQHRHARRWFVVLPALAGIALALAPGAAQAAQSPDTIDQHLELLSDHQSFTFPATNLATVTLNRGTLPGATTGFDPAPT